jgi:uncharacterized protein YbjT (DUF2867 family)
MEKILVIGASGFVGRHIVEGLLADGYAVRCLSRDPARVENLARLGCEIVKGDMSDLASMQQALDSVSAVYVSINTIVPQPGNKAGLRFMEVEKAGLQNIVTACKQHGVRRLIYVTSLGIGPESTIEWTRERWKIQQSLLKSGLDVTVIQPGMICGAGGRGFGMVTSQARRSYAVTLGGGRHKMRSIALGDLIYYLVGVLKEPRAYGQCYDVGCDDTFTIREMIDIAADVFGRRPPRKISIPLGLLSALAPIVEGMSAIPKGAIRGIVDGMKFDAVGDPSAIRMILPRPLLSFRQSVELVAANK